MNQRRVTQPREQRPKPFWRSVGYLLLALGWTAILTATTLGFWLAVGAVARGEVGPFNGTPVGGIVVLVVLGAPLVGYAFFLSPLLTATQAALCLALLRDSVGERDSDPPVAVNTGRRIPILAPARPTDLTALLVSVGNRARLPGGRLLIAVFTLGAAAIALVVAVGWK